MPSRDQIICFIRNLITCICIYQISLDCVINSSIDTCLVHRHTVYPKSPALLDRCCKNGQYLKNNAEGLKCQKTNIFFMYNFSLLCNFVFFSALSLISTLYMNYLDQQTRALRFVQFCTLLQFLAVGEQGKCRWTVFVNLKFNFQTDPFSFTRAQRALSAI